MGADTTSPVIVLVPFPAQGHVTPMLHLARRLQVHGLATKVALPDFIHRRVTANTSEAPEFNAALISLPTDLTDDGGPIDFGAIVSAMENVMPVHLEAVLRDMGSMVVCVVIDLLSSWAVPVASRCGVMVAGFWAAMTATYRVVAAIPELIEDGFISECGIPLSNKFDNHLANQEPNIRTLPLPGQLSITDLPWLIGDTASRKSRFAFWLKILDRTKSIQSILVNSFPCEAGDSEEQISCPKFVHRPRILPIGPLSVSVDNNNKVANQRVLNQQCKNSSMWQEDLTCIDWLDKQESRSVIYVSFGSWVAPIGPETIKELALGLEATGRPFLWVLKMDAAWRIGLPNGYIERVAAAGGRGKVVNWAPQQEVLKHSAIGCYLTHCGWNSTIEAIQHGTRLLCYPISGDQFLNCTYIVKVWQIGLKLNSTNQIEVRNCIEKIMDGKEGKKLQERVAELRKQVIMGEARCQAKKNLENFIQAITSEKLL